MVAEMLRKALRDGGFGGNLDIHLKGAADVCEIVAQYLRVTEPGATNSIAALVDAVDTLLGEMLVREEK